MLYRRALRWLLYLAAAGLLLLAGWWWAPSVVAGALSFPPFTTRPGSVEERMVPMGDGVRLRTAIYHPDGSGPWPALLIRSPYNPAGSMEMMCRFFTRYGYACVFQDVRGRGESEGDWYPLINEREDGLATLRWMVQQPWQNGNIGLFGMSYLAATQWAMADALPPQVKTMVPMMFATDLYAVSYTRGMFRHEVITAWVASMPERTLRFDHGDEYQAALKHRPFYEVDEKFFGRKLDWWREMVASPSPGDAYWQQRGVRTFETVVERVDRPVLVVGGWYDFSIGPTMELFDELGSRQQSRLVVGPWNHLQEIPDTLDEEAGRTLGPQMQLILEWLDHHLKGTPLQQERGEVETYVIGADRWRRAARWPPPGVMQEWSLDALAASTQCEGGLLSQARPVAAQRVGFTYNPDDPVPTLGGAGLLAFALPGYKGVIPGPVEQADVCRREDVLSFVSAPLSQPLHVAGSPQVVLTVTSSAPDTAFTAKLMVVKQGGEAFNIREGITSLSVREDTGLRTDYFPGTSVTLTIPLAPIEWRLQGGERLRLDVSSSSFPAFHAHPNTTEPWARVTEVRVAHQEVLAGGDAVSLLRLPVCHTCSD